MSHNYGSPFLMKTLAAFLYTSELYDEGECKEVAVTLLAAIDELLTRLSALDLSQSEAPDVDIQAVFYQIGKEFYGEFDATQGCYVVEKQVLFNFFKLLYMVYFRREVGPRWGQFINFYGIDHFIVTFETRLGNPWQVPNLGH